MFPWYMIWAPTFHFPFSGAVRQNIAPETDWMIGRIAPGSGDAAVERRVFEEVASYGKQLGLISELLMELADKSRLSPEARRSFARLQEINEQIEQIKVQLSDTRRRRLADALLALRDSDEQSFNAILNTLEIR